MKNYDINPRPQHPPQKKSHCDEASVCVYTIYIYIYIYREREREREREFFF